MRSVTLLLAVFAELSAAEGVDGKVWRFQVQLVWCDPAEARFSTILTDRLHEPHIIKIRFQLLPVGYTTTRGKSVSGGEMSFNSLQQKSHSILLIRV